MRKMRDLAAGMMAIALAGCSLLGSDAADDAEAAFAEQDYLGARDLAAAALQDDEANAAALEVMARAQLAMGAGADALASLDRLAELGASLQDHRLLRAEALLQTGEPAQALSLIGSDASAESWRLRALAAAMADDDIGVREAFQLGREASGGKERLFTAEATYHLRQGNIDEARLAVGRAQEAAPRRVETQFVTAWLAQLEGNNEIAARAFLAILDKTPKDRPAMLGAIDALQSIDRDDLADPLIAQGRGSYPGDLAFVYFAARAHARTGNWAAARDLLQEHEAEMAGEEPAQLLYAEALLELGQAEMARAILTPIRNKRGGDAQVAALYARALGATGS